MVVNFVKGVWIVHFISKNWNACIKKGKLKMSDAEKFIRIQTYTLYRTYVNISLLFHNLFIYLFFYI